MFLLCCCCCFDDIRNIILPFFPFLATDDSEFTKLEKKKSNFFPSRSLEAVCSGSVKAMCKAFQGKEAALVSIKLF